MNGIDKNRLENIDVIHSIARVILTGQEYLLLKLKFELIEEIEKVNLKGIYIFGAKSSSHNDESWADHEMLDLILKGRE